MKNAVVLPFEGVLPKIGNGARLSPWAAAIGRLDAGERLTLLAYATVRADGEHIKVGDDCWHAERSTVHIADREIGTEVGNGLTVGRYAVVHACTVGDACVIGDAAVIMDGAIVGPHAAIAAGGLVPPRKKLEGGWLYSGAPVAPVRRIDKQALEQLRRQLVEGTPDSVVCSSDLPPLHAEQSVPNLTGEPPLYRFGGHFPAAHAETYVAPTAMLAGRVILNKEANVWFGTVLNAGAAEIRLGERTNIQDNCIVEATNGPVIFGNDVTLGHNVRMKSARIDDGALLGMGSIIGEGTVVECGGCVGACAIVEPGTVVRAGYIWAGRPAREFRPVKLEERDFFRRGAEAYIRYLHSYRQHQTDAIAAPNDPNSCAAGSFDKGIRP